VLFQLIEGDSRFLWVIHHAAVDGVSWRLLLEDLAAVYDQLERGRVSAVPALRPKTTSFRRWSERLGDLANSDILRREADWWLARPWDEVAPLPVDGANGAGTVADERQVAVALEPEETRALLEEVPRLYNSQINDALLSALGRAFHAWCGVPVLLVDLEGHGREDLFPDVDLSRTVGWFTSVFPVLLDLRQDADPGGALKATKELLRSIPNGGLGWGLLHQSPEAARLTGLPAPQVSFNYLGQLDQGLPAGLPFAAAAESAGSNRSPRAPRAHLLEWNGSIAGGRLRFVCTYAEGAWRRDGVERLAAGFAQALRELIGHCRTPGAGGYTPSDFPLAGLNQGQLDKVLARRKKTR
jgi:non-ribosomal peptide synthase protein (TIGR01720 family)